ncbi:hypothetical protein HDU67_004055 [Dinochytrium kinnereticum]|nr:hypothetical protein HDU67_004055 [Dinochytrium kinnereticum]
MLAWLYTISARQPAPTPSPETADELPRSPSPDVDNWILLPEDDGAHEASGGTISPLTMDATSPFFRAILPSTDAEADQIHDDISEVYTVDSAQLCSSDQVTHQGHPSPPASPTRSIKPTQNSPTQQYNMSRKARKRILRQLAVDHRQEAADDVDGALDAAAEREADLDSEESSTARRAGALRDSANRSREIPTLLLLQRAASRGQASHGNKLHPVLDKMKKVESSATKMRKGAVADALAASTSGGDWQKRAGHHRVAVTKSGRGNGSASSGAFGLM